MRLILPVAAAFAVAPSAAWAIDLAAGVAIPGQPFTLTVTNAPANAPVFVLLSTTGIGPGPCHPTAAVCADILSPRVIAQGRADAAGTRIVTVIVPANVPVGNTIHLQAAWVQAGAGDVSAPVTVTTTGACAPYEESYAPRAPDYLVAGDVLVLAQTVTPAQDFTLETVTLPLWTCRADGTPDVQVKILGTDANGYPDDANVLAISDVVPNSALLDDCTALLSGIPVTFTLASPLALTAGTTYAIGLLSLNDPAGISWTSSSPGYDPYNPYAGGTWFEKYELSIPPRWMPGDDALDLAFQLQGCD